MATLDLLFPCKKVRRSQRLEIKEKFENWAKTVSDGPLGYFDILPLEVKFTVFTYLRGENTFSVSQLIIRLAFFYLMKKDSL